jgi:hypothetical protein
MGFVVAMAAVFFTMFALPLFLMTVFVRLVLGLVLLPLKAAFFTLRALVGGIFLTSKLVAGVLILASLFAVGLLLPLLPFVLLALVLRALFAKPQALVPSGFDR